MIDPNGIPQYDGDPAAITAQAQAMRSGADAFAATGQDVNGTWQGLGGVYSAPESGQLLSATRQVADRSAALAGDVEGVSAALVTFAETMTPIKARLEQLAVEARAFVSSVAGDDDWTDDGDKVDRHNAMLSEVGSLVAEWQAAERACANAIHAAFGSDVRYRQDDGDENVEADEYGYGEDTYDAAVEEEVDLPWGTQEHEDPGVLGNIGGFFQGLGESAWGDVVGLAGLVGLRGGDAFTESWSTLGTLAGTALPSFDGGLHWELSDEESQLWSAFGSSMVAADMWHENAGRASGQVLWNFGSLLIGGAGAVGKAGKLGKIGEVAARAGRVSVESLFESGVRVAVGDFSSRLTRLTGRIDVHVDVPERVDVDPGVTSRLGEGASVSTRLDVDAGTAHVDAPSGGLDAPSTGAPDGPGAPDTPGIPDSPGTPDAPAGVDGQGGVEGPSGPDSPGSPDAPDAGGNTPPPDLTGPPRQSFESDLTTSAGAHAVDADHPLVDTAGMTSNERGRLGEALTQADLERQAFRVLANQNQVLLPGADGRYFVPDFIVKNDATGQVLAVESKFGPGARYTPGQLTGYDYLAGGGRIEMRSDAAAGRLLEEGVFRVDGVVTYRWNTEIVPDAALRAEADAIVAARDAAR